MSKRDWSLVFFTILTQWSVGIILCFAWLAFFSPGTGPLFDTGLHPRNPAVLALILIGSATLSSFLHLGNPANAPRALNNLSGSWLSREILAIGVFSASLLIVFLIGLKSGEPGTLKYPLLLGGICGLALLWMMIRIYVMPTIPAWNGWYTPVSFATTAICLGLLTCLAMHLAGWINTSMPIARDFTFALGVTLLIEIVSAISQQRKLTELEPGLDELVFDRGVFYRVFLFRMAFLIFICQFVFILVVKPDLLPGNSDSFWLWLLFILTIAQELMGRLLFYSSYFRIGV